MMKQQSKFFSVSALMLLNIMIPSFVYAEVGATSSAVSTQTHFCASLDAATQKISQNLIEKEGKYASKEKDRETRWEEKVSAHELTTQNTRQGSDATHDRLFAKLLAHATSEKEKTAIDKFTQEFDIAISKRRTSVDAAVTTFNSESAKLIATRTRDIDNATTTLRNATIKAGNTTKANCKNGLAGTTVRTRYARDLKNARMQFQANVTSALKRNEGISILIKNRDTDVKKAVNVFKDTLATLRTELESSVRAN